MNKMEFIDEVAKKTSFTKKETAVLLDAVLITLTEQLTKKNSVALYGFGTFDIKHRPSR